MNTKLAGGRGYALVTGASSGLGEEFARQLAVRRWSLVLVARSKDKLERLREALLAQHTDIDVHVAPIDLTAHGAAAEVFRRTQAAKMEVSLLVNNAGFGAFGKFEAIGRERQRQMLDLNIAALVELAHLYLQPMKQRHRGTVVNIASVAGFVPLPYSTVYAATKAFVVSFSQGLHEEAAQFGVHVLLVNPGSTATNFFQVAGMRPFGPKSRMQTPRQVVQEALRALDRGRASVTTGAVNRFIVHATALIPSRWIARMIGSKLRSSPELKG